MIEHLGMQPFPSVEQAVAAAREIHGRDAAVASPYIQLCLIGFSFSLKAGVCGLNQHIAGLLSLIWLLF
ncbi:hypothetical protein D1AOALGA4SA_9472 [Olavius algarvensis Delta 1 endosymbiont]|nr:hypothetical protein D1AOALGA4SA_9472 [Olavius algarvensis Delta 1 endosymbiont]